jgi:integrase/recombinase XerD
VYQGITSGEVAKLETNHINLMEGKIYIPATRKGNARILKLQATQILPIKSYLEELQVTSYKLQEFTQNPYLFPTKKHTDLVSSIIKQVRKQNTGIINSRQIRASVIMNWLKSNNIRQVQYMAGHRSIVSTEEYRNQDLTDLSKQLELFHPLK